MIGELQGVIDPLSHPVLPTYRKAHYEKAVLRVEQRERLFKAFLAVEKKLQTQGRHYRKRGLGIHEAEYNHVRVLACGAGLMKEGTTVIDMEAHLAGIVGMFGVQLTSELGDGRIDFHGVDASALRTQGRGHVVTGACTNDQYSSAGRQDRVGKIVVAALSLKG